MFCTENLVTSFSGCVLRIIFLQPKWSIKMFCYERKKDEFSPKREILLAAIKVRLFPPSVLESIN